MKASARFIFCLVSLFLLVALPLWSKGSTEVPKEEAVEEKPTEEPAEEMRKEVPMFADAVASGALPSVDKRLPADPMVVDAEQIGKYGGTFRGAMLAVETGDMLLSLQPIARPTQDYSGIRPNIAKGWEISSDLKGATLYLREGMKWSDGHPFTADDIMFWYDDMLQVSELYPVMPRHWSPAGKLLTIDRLDDYAVHLNFEVPNPTIVTFLAGGLASVQRFFYAPAHYLKQFHIKYNEDADALAVEAGYEQWHQNFMFHVDSLASRQDVDLPVLSPWVMKERTSDRKTYERNAYYWKTDRAGNQLPYIDRAVLTAMNKETMILKLIAGELDFEAGALGPTDLPLLMENRESGDYRVLQWPTSTIADPGIAFNMTHPDQVLRDIFRDVRFRKAMSIAINRDELNEVIYLGLAEPRAFEVLPSWRIYDERRAKVNIQYDPEEANRLLDEMGLKWDKNHEWRLRPDGETLSILLETVAVVGGRPTDKISALLADYWEKIGVQFTLKTIERSLHLQRRGTNQLQMYMWPEDRSDIEGAWINAVGPFNFIRQDLTSAPLWGFWFWTRGKQGEEPPADVVEYADSLEAARQMDPDSQEYMDTLNKALDFWSEKIYVIGLVGLTKNPVLVKNNLRNVPDEIMLGFSGGASVADPDVWYFVD